MRRAVAERLFSQLTFTFNQLLAPGFFEYLRIPQVSRARVDASMVDKDVDDALLRA